MTDEDLERAVAAAMKFGLRTPEEIAPFAKEWLAPMVHLEVREPSSEELCTGLMVVRLTIARPSGASH